MGHAMILVAREREIWIVFPLQGFPPGLANHISWRLGVKRYTYGNEDASH